MSGNSNVDVEVMFLYRVFYYFLLIVDLQVTRWSSIASPMAPATWWGKGRRSGKSARK